MVGENGLKVLEKWVVQRQNDLNFTCDFSIALCRGCEGVWMVAMVLKMGGAKGQLLSLHCGMW